MYKAKQNFIVPGHKVFKKNEVYDIIPKVASDLKKRGLVEEVKKSEQRRKNNKAEDNKSDALKE